MTDSPRLARISSVLRSRDRKDQFIIYTETKSLQKLPKSTDVMKAPWREQYRVTHPPYTVREGWVLKRLLRWLTKPLKKLSRRKLVTAGKISTSVPSQNFNL
ncbi:MAG: hypothetical protein BRC49_14340 [Cyanobacteria bacterium SW_10_48_33]|nr:MAG: hypothetical protein BRC49_14340 [Cyanobacteria bacterium SW_10_48_33]